eukprot:jgi/Chrzof1/7845/Cz02g38190.t1
MLVVALKDSQLSPSVTAADRAIPLHTGLNFPPARSESLVECTWKDVDGTSITMRTLPPEGDTYYPGIGMASTLLSAAPHMTDAQPVDSFHEESASVLNQFSNPGRCVGPTSLGQANTATNNAAAGSHHTAGGLDYLVNQQQFDFDQQRQNDTSTSPSEPANDPEHVKEVVEQETLPHHQHHQHNDNEGHASDHGRLVTPSEPANNPALVKQVTDRETLHPDQPADKQS